MMEDVFIIRRQIEAIPHNAKTVAMIVEEWRSLDEITILTIWMHLAKNVYLSMPKETMAFTSWGELQAKVELIKTHTYSAIIE